jgi:hypothetical protein
VHGRRRIKMKIAYILLVLLLIVSALGCVGKNPSEVTPTTVPTTETSVSSAGTSISPSETPAPSSNDDFEAQSDINAMDSLVNDSSMDISLSDVNI